ncbi:uncharacterized protein LOC122064583 [Macadamia integrifolia]|uniref:uncharacterized protein LOC122064583 n=1 Tax=Macadamia integrifolia TaxID=60698 RepID=UPI001C4F25B9|nr:uncharacterized protein LOC122064583 [Macadamia integrifolia]
MRDMAMLRGLRLKEKNIFWGLVFIILIHGIVDGKLVHGEKLIEINKKLKQINRPAVRSIQSEDGDIIDCIDIYKQPAFDHPALRSHTIQMRPSYDPALETSVKKDELHGALEASQLWRKSGSCPEGTIPIRRIRKQDLLRADSLEDFGRKYPSFSTIAGDIHQNSGINYTIKAYNKAANHSVAILLSQGTAYLGAQGDINVWNPYVASDDEYSAAEISLKNGPYDDFESIESGWAVNPKVYGDRRTRLFAYWTTDASKKTGCFDLTCPGFVQTSKSIALGSVFDTISKIQGVQYQISISIQMDTNTGNWWLKYGGQNIGYWPKSLFVGLSHMASSVEWGGEVKSSHIGQTHPHTGTDMGSGRMVGVGFGFDCFIRNIRILDNSVTWKFPTYSFPYTDEYYCYDIYYQRQGVPEPEFYFGGPGYDEIRCP